MEMCDKMETDFKNGSYLMLKNSQVMVRQYQKLEYVRKLIAQGNKPDIYYLITLIVLNHQNFTDVNVKEVL
jgi:hypothetical protein